MPWFRYVVRRLPAVLAVTLSALPGPSLAQRAVPIPPHSALPSSSPDRPGPSSGIVGLLQRTMAGKPVIAVNYHGDDALIPEPAFREGSDTLERLQAIAAAAGDNQHPRIPYVVGKTWVIAPQTREALNAALPHLGLADAAPRGLAFDAFLATLTPGQARALGADQGLSTATLSEETRNALAAALNPPLRVVASADADAASKGTAAAQQVTILDITEPLDLSALSVRAFLANNGVTVPQDQNSSLLLGLRNDKKQQSGLWLADAEGVSRGYGDESGLPITVEAPNTFKPSELRTESLTQPIGIHGAVSVADLIQRLRTATGLDLYASAPYQDLVVFLGSGAIPCADVLDGLRLALTATWRRIERAYLLAWDRDGLRAIQQRTHEQTRALRAQMSGYRDKSRHIGTWLALANDLPYDPNDPLSPTPEQRARLVPGLDGTWKFTSGIPYQDLTPLQKITLLEWLQAHGRGSEDVVSKGRLEAYGNVMLSVQIPGAGWAAVPHTWNYGSVVGGNLAAEAAIAKARQGIKPELPASLRDQKSAALTAPVRGILIPALPLARVADFAKEMKRHGINTLFYPLLSNGYATLKSQAFPLSPTLHDNDGLAEVVTAMKAEGIQVVGTVDTLAWQNEGHNAHWLSKHRDWLDVDALGRPRLDWLKQFPDRVAAAYQTGIVPSNYVLAGEPSVAERLQQLVSEAAKQPGMSGIAFAAWRPAQPLPYTDALQPPALGFSVPDRLQGVRRHGLDPVDQPAQDDGRSEYFLPRRLGKQVDSWSAAVTEEDRKDAPCRLAEDLIRLAKAAQPNWTVYLINDFASADYISYWDGPAIPKADLLISTRPADEKADGVLLPVWPSDAATDDDSLPLIEPGIEYAWQWSHRPPLTGAKAVVYDFRAAPSRITETLQWIAPPPAPPGKG